MCPWFPRSIGAGGTTLKTVTLNSYGFFVSMTMHYLYILYSKSVSRYYVGETSDIDNRLSQHNAHYFYKSFTKSAEDWEVVLSKKCSTKADSVYLERFIKRMKSSKFIEKIIEDRKILDEILLKK